MASPIHVLAIAGSLRTASYNKRLIQVAGELLPAGMTMETFDLAPLPMYNEDLVRESGYPESVRHLHARLAASDALLISTPEYCFSIPGVLKNAIDWASVRTADGQISPLNDKPMAIMGGGGRLGTARAQLHLREIVLHNNVHVLNAPQVYVIGVRNHFDQEGNLIDPATRDQIGQLMTALAAWTRQLRGH
ncbi:MAG TPA: NAD(P)H-dependent oxidoreductase [Caldilineaceae bacterium]|nr:NAD(P)H-dependent oxidoreductase [Caldilineaceae bacterium]